MVVSELLTTDWLRMSWQRLLAWAAVLLAVLACIWMATQMAWTLLMPLTNQSADSSLVDAGVASRSTAAPVNLASLHLFGNGHADDARRRMLEASQVTQLNLTLHGTVSGEDSRRGFALIADSSGVARSYRVGDRIQDGVSLRAVRADHVILDHDGRNERLNLPRNTLADAGSVQPLPSEQGVVGNRHSQTAQPPSSSGEGASGSSLFVAPRMAHGKVDWQNLDLATQDNPAQVMDQLNLMPVFDGMQLQGVRLGNAGRSLLAGTGLQPEDVVTSVNGIELDSIARGQQLFHELKGSSHVQLTVLRNGQSQTIEIDLSKLR